MKCWVDTDRVSFVAATRSRRLISQVCDLSPHDRDGRWNHVAAMLADRLNPKRRRRSKPRLIKRKMSKWHVKRRHHRRWPQPENRPATIFRQATELDGIGTSSTCESPKERPNEQRSAVSSVTSPATSTRSSRSRNFATFHLTTTESSDPRSGLPPAGSCRTPAATGLTSPA